jgi:hypothetical protein
MQVVGTPLLARLFWGSSLYQLVGDAYVHNITTGEAWNLSKFPGQLSYIAQIAIYCLESYLPRLEPFLTISHLLTNNFI